MRKFSHERLKAMRNKAGVSRGELVRRLLVKDWNAAEASVLQWERKRLPALPTFLAICAEIGPPHVRKAATVLLDEFVPEVVLNSGK